MNANFYMYSLNEIIYIYVIKIFENRILHISLKFS